MPTQDIRHSQFIISYGPGALLEGRRGPRVILSAGIGLFHAGLSPERLEIPAGRISGVLPNIRLYRPPVAVEATWRTIPFPGWALCVEHWILYLGACPECGQSRRRSQAIRFIMACRAGHLDDVNWPALIHGSRQCTHNRWFKWIGGGGALRELRVECPQCRATASLADAYNRPWMCTGRWPERELPGTPPTRPMDCSSPARIIQRQASNLRVPVLQTLFTIPPKHTALHRLLGIPQILTLLRALGGLEAAGKFSLFTELLRNLKNSDPTLDAVEAGILRYSEAEVVRAASEVLAPPPGSMAELLAEEFRALLEASGTGVPAVGGSGFEIIRDHIRTVPTPGGRLLRVVPVSKLRTVTVQVGFRRLVEPNPIDCRQVSVAWTSPTQETWLPGVEYIGEGIFVMLDGDGWLTLTGDSARSWRRIAEDPSPYTNVPFRGLPCDELDPVFVWWHTLSHLLIRALALHSGYGSASVRERVYLERDGAKARGGVMLYTSQPTADGSLGGLVALVPQFQSMLDAAMDALLYCSNGYLCDENRFSPGAHGGASCYGCTVVSETSCEHRNMWLDRQVLLESMP
jgi:hypothetical protein